MPNKTDKFSPYKATTARERATNDSRVELWLGYKTIQFLREKYPSDSLENAVLKTINYAQRSDRQNRESQALKNARNEIEQLQRHVVYLNRALEDEIDYVRRLHQHLESIGFKLVYEDV